VNATLNLLQALVRLVPVQPLQPLQILQVQVLVLTSSITAITIAPPGDPARALAIARAKILKSSDPSWAHFSVAFSRAGDLTFPIFTKPDTSTLL
jgi:hypothetical protein